MENRVNINRISNRDVSEKYKTMTNKLEKKFSHVKPCVDHFIEKYKANRIVFKTHSFQILLENGTKITTFLKSTKKLYAALYAIYMYDKFGDKTLLNRPYRIEKYITIAREILSKDIASFIRLHKKTPFAKEPIFIELSKIELTANNFGDIKKIFNDIKHILLGITDKKFGDLKIDASDFGRSVKNSKIMTHKHNESRLVIIKHLLSFLTKEDIEKATKKEKISKDAVDFLNSVKSQLKSLTSKDIDLLNAIKESEAYLQTHKLQNYRDKPKPGNLKFQALVDVLKTHNINLEESPCFFLKMTKAGRKPKSAVAIDKNKIIRFKTNTSSFNFISE